MLTLPWNPALAMPRPLDNLRLVAKVDSGRMLGAIDNSPTDLVSFGKFMPDRKPSFERDFRGVVLMGMGGSASAADVLVDWLGERIRVPLAVVREPRLPGFAGEGTLFVGFSYSGETSETLQAYREARARGCSILAVGSGGRLGEDCRMHADPFFRVDAGMVPRAALSQMVAAGGLALETVGIVKSVRGDLAKASDELRRVSDRFMVENPSSKNPAKQFASRLLNRFAVIYSLQRMGSVARRFKNQLAENAKVVSKYDLLPEAGHNEIEGFDGGERNMLAVFVRGWDETIVEKGLIRAFKETVVRSGSVRGFDVRVRAVSRLGRLMAPILFLDYVSVYLAVLRGVDPSPTLRIREYRRRLSSLTK